MAMLCTILCNFHSDSYVMNVRYTGQRMRQNAPQTVNFFKIFPACPQTPLAMAALCAAPHRNLWMKLAQLVPKCNPLHKILVTGLTMYNAI